ERVGGGGGQELLLDDRVGLGFGGGEPHRPRPHALGAQRHRRRHLAAPGDAPGGQYRQGRHGVDDLGDEHHGGDLAGVAAGLVALGHDDVDAGGHVTL